MDDARSIGQRLRQIRQRRGLSQDVVAGLTGISKSYLSLLERGERHFNRRGLIEDLADVLGCSAADLTGTPPATMTAVHDRVPTARARSLNLLREALMGYSVLTDTPSEARPMPPDQLRFQVDDVWSAYQGSRLGYVTMRLPSLLTGARAALHEANAQDQEREARRALALIYHAAAATLTKLGEADLSWIASDRGLTAAEQADDAVAVAALLRSVSHSMLANGRYAEAADVATRATTRFEATRRRDPAWWSLVGSLDLVGAMAAARAGAGTEARTFLARARRASQKLGHDANHVWTAFGPTNVAVHDVSVALELGDIQIALDRAPRVDARALPVERRVRHALELARIYSLANRQDDAVTTVLRAERDAPEQVRHHYIAHGLVDSWTQNRCTRGRPDIGALARRLRTPDPVAGARR